MMRGIDKSGVRAAETDSIVLFLAEKIGSAEKSDYLCASKIEKNN